MKKLSIEEASGIVPMRKGRFTWLYKALVELKIGEAIIIHNSDWKTKTPPYRSVRNAEKRFSMKFDYGRLRDDSGWIVKRVK